MKLISARLQLEGIVHESDAERVERDLQYINGVMQVSVDFQTGLSYVLYNAEETSIHEIEETIRYLGYENHPLWVRRATK
jgi:copper chaperone CopZ